jgi:arylformamidase
MYKPFSRIVDPTHEMYHGMPNIGGFAHRVLAGAPRHFDRDGKSLAQLPLEQLILPGHPLDFRHKRNGDAVTFGDFEEAIAKSGQLSETGTAVVCWTARWLVEQGMTMFATDLIGMDDPSEWWWPTHEIWLKAGSRRASA